jgi:hypothetical protein
VVVWRGIGCGVRVALQALQAVTKRYGGKKGQCEGEVQSWAFSNLVRQICIVLSNSQLLRRKGVVGHILLLKS